MGKRVTYDHPEMMGILWVHDGYIMGILWVYYGIYLVVDILGVRMAMMVGIGGHVVCPDRMQAKVCQSWV